jgi:hypothetical protein
MKKKLKKKVDDKYDVLAHQIFEKVWAKRPNENIKSFDQLGSWTCQLLKDIAEVLLEDPPQMLEEIMEEEVEKARFDGEQMWEEEN